MQYTDVDEGTIVRCITRLDEVIPLQKSFPSPRFLDNFNDLKSVFLDHYSIKKYTTTILN